MHSLVHPSVYSSDTVKGIMAHVTVCSGNMQHKHLSYIPITVFTNADQHAQTKYNPQEFKVI